jgi:hypothetical protein
LRRYRARHRRARNPDQLCDRPPSLPRLGSKIDEATTARSGTLLHAAIRPSILIAARQISSPWKILVRYACDAPVSMILNSCPRGSSAHAPCQGEKYETRRGRALQQESAPL